MFWSQISNSGVGQGNPNAVTYKNDRHRYEITYLTTDFQFSSESEDLVQLVGIKDPASFVNIFAWSTIKLSTSQLGKDESVQGCKPVTVATLNGFECEGYIVLLVPGSQIIRIDLSKDEKAQEVLKSFKYFTRDRLFAFSLGRFEFEQDSWSSFLGLIDQDQKMVIISNSRITVRNVKDLSIFVEIPYESTGLYCSIHDKSMQIACGDSKAIHVWSLRDGQEIWRYENTEPYTSFYTPEFIDEKTLLYKKTGKYTGPLYEIKIGSKQPIEKFNSAYQFDLFYLGQELYIVIRNTDYQTQVIDYRSKKVLQTFPEFVELVPVPNEKKIIGRRYPSSSPDVIEIFRLDAKTLNQDWTVYYSKYQTDGQLKVGSDFFAISNFNGNIYLYDLATGKMRPEFIQTLFSYTSIGNGSFSFEIGEDNKTFFRKGPSDLTISRLGTQTQFKKIETNAKFNFLKSINSEFFLTEKEQSVILYSTKTLEQKFEILLEKESNSWQSFPSIASDFSKVYRISNHDVLEFDAKTGKILTKIYIQNPRSVVALSSGSFLVATDFGLSKIELPSQKETELVSHRSLGNLELDAHERYLIFSGEDDYNADEYFVYDLLEKRLLYRSQIKEQYEGRPCKILYLEHRKDNGFMIGTQCGVYLKNLKTDVTIKKFNLPYSFFEPIRISPSEKYYAIHESRLDRILVFDMQTGKKVNELWGHADPRCTYSSVGFDEGCKGTDQFMFLPDDSIVTTGADNSMRFWHPK